MDLVFLFTAFFYSAVVGLIANSYPFLQAHGRFFWPLMGILLLVNLFAGRFTFKTASKKLRNCHRGTLLLCAFSGSVIISVIRQVSFALTAGSLGAFLLSLLLCVFVNLVVFWNGILSVYLTSTQLGFKLRLVGILCGMIPIANVIALFFIIRTTARECLLEGKKELTNASRKAQQVCATKYPILLVHGVFFRDSEQFNYWGRIPGELEVNGARVFYGNHGSASAVADSAAELAARINEILAQTGAQKVNIIAHSKGGLDCRYAISKLGMADRVASLTTINTPHRGCLFADYLLTRISSDVQQTVANTYNATLHRLGDTRADFLAAVNNLTDSFCQPLDDAMGAPAQVYCQSVGSVMPKATDGTFPLNYTYHLVRYFDGENDGLVSESSFRWGQNYILLRPRYRRGISHGDMVDLTRENIPGFDVREFYVGLVSDLKMRGF